MKVFRVEAAHDLYDACQIDYDACKKLYPHLDSYSMNLNLDGERKSSDWWRRKIVRFGELPLGDYISHLVGDAIILTYDAIQKLQTVLGENEILPLECDFGDYWAVNVLNVLDCIDYDKADYKLFPNQREGERPRIMRFRKYAFLPERLSDCHIFKIIDEPKSSIFVDEVFVNEVSKQYITGFSFNLVWEG